MLFRRKKEKKGMTWDDITLGQYQRVKALDLTDVADQITAGEILLGIDASNMTWKDFCVELNKLNFMKEELPETIVRNSYTLNGRKYNCIYNLQQMSVARYIDFMNLIKTGDVVKILGVFLVPEGKEYGDYDIEKVYDDIRSMNVVEAYGIFNFFRVQFVACIKTTEDYLVKAVKMDKTLQAAISAGMECYCM